MSKSSERRKRQQLAKRQAAIPATPPSSTPISQGGFISVGTSYSGPIPPPSMLREFNEIIPDGANRILTMAENQAKHRQSLESALLSSDIRRSWAGLFVAGIIVTVAIITGGLVAFNGQPWAGAAIAGAPSAAVVGVFIYGTSARTAERTEKAKIMSGQKQP